jgi:pimeloyl-ACP methyl ester carboxylesterase
VPTSTRSRPGNCGRTPYCSRPRHSGVPSTAPDRRHPTTYIIAAQESDQSIPVPMQEAMAANADNVVRLPAAHFVQLSRPDELAEVLGRI